MPVRTWAGTNRDDGRAITQHLKDEVFGGFPETGVQLAPDRWLKGRFESHCITSARSLRCSSLGTLTIGRGVVILEIGILGWFRKVRTFIGSGAYTQPGTGHGEGYGRRLHHRSLAHGASISCFPCCGSRRCASERVGW